MTRVISCVRIKGVLNFNKFLIFVFPLEFYHVVIYKLYTMCIVHKIINFVIYVHYGKII